MMNPQFFCDFFYAENSPVMPVFLAYTHLTLSNLNVNKSPTLVVVDDILTKTYWAGIQQVYWSFTSKTGESFNSVCFAQFFFLSYFLFDFGRNWSELCPSGTLKTSIIFTLQVSVAVMMII